MEQDEAVDGVRGAAGMGEDVGARDGNRKKQVRTTRAVAVAPAAAVPGLLRLPALVMLRTMK